MRGFVGELDDVREAFACVGYFGGGEIVEARFLAEALQRLLGARGDASSALRRASTNGR
jgi:hypothetical protein